MPEFMVHFPTPVRYQAGHYKAEAHILQLHVRAPDATGALMHAVRVVQGDYTGATVEPYTAVPTLPPVEVS
jgi:hypothetical protein